MSIDMVLTDFFTGMAGSSLCDKSTSELLVLSGFLDGFTPVRRLPVESQ